MKIEHHLTRKSERQKAQVPYHCEKGPVQIGREARSRAVLAALGIASSPETFSATPPDTGRGVEDGPGKLTDAIRSLKG